MKIQRTLPPAAAPVSLRNVLHGLTGLITGKEFVGLFEQELRDYLEVKHVFLVSSGKVALTVILKALKSLSPSRDEVIIPAYTCFSVPSAILKAGLKIRPCDINPLNLDFDYGLLETAISKNTLCAIPNHLFGIPANMDRIVEICRKKEIFVVEDAAQAMGGTYRGKKLGTLGDAGFFSLGRSKNITCGSGGIIVTSSDPLSLAIKKEYLGLQDPNTWDNLRELTKAIGLWLFTDPALYWMPAGLRFLKLGETVFPKNFPLKTFSRMQAGFMKDWERHLESFNTARRQNARYFIEKLDLKWENDEGFYLRLPFLGENSETRKAIFSLSSKRGLGIGNMYPTPINEIVEIKGEFDGTQFPVAKEISERLLTIPTHPFMTAGDKKRIAEMLEGLVGGSGQRSRIH